MRESSSLGCLLSLICTTAFANLEGRAPITPGGNDYQAYYDTSTGVTWLANANLAKTNTFGVSDICADDSFPCNGQGTMAWDTAQNWMAAMNASNGGLGYIGVNTWRLPAVRPVDNVTVNYNFSYDGSTDYGYNLSAPNSAFPGSTASELAHLFYATLGNSGQFNTSGTFTPCQSAPSYCVSHVGPFLNFVPLSYWYGTPRTASAWAFQTNSGFNFTIDKSIRYLAWPVVDGDPLAENIVVVDFDSTPDSLGGVLQHNLTIDGFRVSPSYHADIIDFQTDNLSMGWDASGPQNSDYLGPACVANQNGCASIYIDRAGQTFSLRALKARGYQLTVQSSKGGFLHVVPDDYGTLQTYNFAGFEWQDVAWILLDRNDCGAPCQVVDDLTFAVATTPAQAYNEAASTIVNTTTPVTIPITKNDLGFTDPVTAAVSSPAQHGTVQIAGSPGVKAGIVASYTPALGFAGVDSFQYSVSDGVNSSTASAYILVKPLAVNDVVTTPNSQAIMIAVAANDLGFVDPVYVEITAGAQHGSTNVNGYYGPQASVSIKYIPTANYIGLDSFTYTAFSSSGKNHATVYIDVTGPDADGDRIADSVDNCVNSYNPSQLDTDGDGFGNACDADLNNDGIVNYADLAIFRKKFGTTDSNADLDGNGVVSYSDLALFRQLFGKAPGPSGTRP